MYWPASKTVLGSFDKTPNLSFKYFPTIYLLSLQTSPVTCTSFLRNLISIRNCIVLSYFNNSYPVFLYLSFMMYLTWHSSTYLYILPNSRELIVDKYYTKPVDLNLMVAWSGNHIIILHWKSQRRRFFE